MYWRQSVTESLQQNVSGDGVILVMELLGFLDGKQIKIINKLLLK